MSEANKVSQEATNSDGNTFVGKDFNGILNEGVMHIGVPAVAEDMGIIAIIFKYVTDNIHECNNYDKSKPPAGWVKTSEKIQINFSLSETQTVVGYYKYTLPKVRMIEQYFQTLDSENQAELHSHMFGMYSVNKANGMSPIDNLHKLFEAVIPANQKLNARYTSMAKSLVLFFFEDCTIFEKTLSESMQLGLW